MSDSLKQKSNGFLNRARYSPEPKYPKEAREKDIEGDCLVSFQINLDGMTEDTNAKCTNDIFINPTESALKKWEFQPDEYINPMVYVIYSFKNN